MIDIFWPKYSELKQKDKRWVREKCYSDAIIESLCSMFRYTCEDKIMEKEWNLRAEMLLRLYGKIGICKDESGKLVFGQCHWAGSTTGHDYIDYLGYGKEVVIVTTNGKKYQKKYNVDCVVMFNNQLGHSELNVMRFVEQLAEVDLSQVDLLINARMHPIIVCHDEATRIAIESALKDKELGSTASVVDSGAIESALLGDSRETVQVITITDPQTAALFQYYSHYHLDLTGRLYGMFGLSTFNTGKMAQTNNLEVSGTLASSMCIPMMNKYWRETGVAEIERLLGVKISVEFTECWKHQEFLMNNDLVAGTSEGETMLPENRDLNEEENNFERNNPSEENNNTIRKNRIRRIEQSGH